MMAGAQAAQIRRYLESGEADVDPLEWPGANIIEQGRTQHATLTGALIAEVRCRATGAEPPVVAHLNP